VSNPPSALPASDLRFRTGAWRWQVFTWLRQIDKVKRAQIFEPDLILIAEHEHERLPLLQNREHAALYGTAGAHAWTKIWTYLILGVEGTCSLRCGAVASFMVEQRREAVVVAWGKTCASLIF